MNPGTNITANSGCTLKVENYAVIRSSSLSMPWGGIKAIGNSSIEQYSTLPNPFGPYPSSVPDWEGVLNTSQTLVKLSHATIRESSIGIDCQDGAILRTSDNTHIEECEIGVNIQNYSSPTKPKVNACFLMNTVIQNSYLYFNFFTNFNFIALKLTNVEGIRLGGLVIRNGNTNNIAQRGTGISSTNSSFTMEHDGNTFCLDSYGCLDNCSGGGNIMEWLDFPIIYNGSLTADKEISVRFTQFNSNLNNVQISNASYVYISQNQFTTDQTVLSSHYSVPLPSRFDLKIDGSDIVGIIDNTFDDNTASFTTMDLSNSISGAKHYIAKNTLTNNISPGTNGIGIQLNGDFTNTKITCNSFNNLTTSINILSGSVLGDQIRQVGTLTGLDPQNTFTLGSPSDIVNSGGVRFYYFTGIGNPTGDNIYILDLFLMQELH